MPAAQHITNVLSQRLEGLRVLKLLGMRSQNGKTQWGQARGNPNREACMLTIFHRLGVHRFEYGCAFLLCLGDLLRHFQFADPALQISLTI